LIPVGILLILAFAIGNVCRELGTEPFVAPLVEAGLPAWVIPATLFVVSAFISFSTGTSFGTRAIMIPIGVPLSALLGLNPALTTAAVLEGGLFGDHCSRTSDSTILSSMAAGTDHVDHVRTQMPYVLLVAGATTLLYVVFGLLLR
jgi:Na+/H+ antiporter NhaC